MDFLLKEENRIRDFLVFSYDLNKGPWCEDLEDPDSDVKFAKVLAPKLDFCFG